MVMDIEDSESYDQEIMMLQFTQSNPTTKRSILHPYNRESPMKIQVIPLTWSPSRNPDPKEKPYQGADIGALV